MDTIGMMFDWGYIITKKLNSRIEQAQNPNPDEVPSFYMAPYLSDAICVRIFFAKLNISWHILEAPMHV